MHCGTGKTTARDKRGGRNTTELLFIVTIEGLSVCERRINGPIRAVSEGFLSPTSLYFTTRVNMVPRTEGFLAALIEKCSNTPSELKAV